METEDQRVDWQESVVLLEGVDFVPRPAARAMAALSAHTPKVLAPVTPAVFVVDEMAHLADVGSWYEAQERLLPASQDASSWLRAMGAFVLLRASARLMVLAYLVECHTDRVG